MVVDTVDNDLSELVQNANMTDQTKCVTQGACPCKTASDSCCREDGSIVKLLSEIGNRWWGLARCREERIMPP